MTEWTDENVEEAVKLLTAKMQNMYDSTLEDIVATVVADMALLTDGPLTLDDYRHADHTTWDDMKTRRKRSLNDRFTDWYDRQSFETIALVSLIPMMLLVVVLIACALIWG